MTMRRVRAKAEAELGPRFDIRKFHDVVLSLGSVPLPALEARIDAFIADGGEGEMASAYRRGAGTRGVINRRSDRDANGETMNAKLLLAPALAPRPSAWVRCAQNYAAAEGAGPVPQPVPG